MSRRVPCIALLAAALAAWWVSDHQIVPWVERVAGYDRIQNRDLSVLLGHRVFGQLPRVLVCLAVWLVGERFGLMPPLRGCFGSGGSCVVFAAGHEQYSVALRVVVGLVAVVFVYPWVSARSLWAPWIPHTLGDFIGDTILKL